MSSDLWFVLLFGLLGWAFLVGAMLWLRRGIFADKRADECKDARGDLSVVTLPGCNYCPNPDCDNLMFVLALANYCNKCGAQLPAKTVLSVKELQELADEFDASMVGGICSEFDHRLKLDREPVIAGKQTAFCSRCGKKLESTVPPRS